jgi:hypothetical protein
MGRFDKEYYFIKHPGDEHFPALTPDADTVNKPYTTEILPFGQKPLIFHNGALDFALQRGIIPISPPPDVLFNGSELVVCGRIAKRLDDMEIPHLAIQPAIYIDHKKKWYEDYWFLTFTKDFDCWDRKRSIYEPEPMPSNPSMYDVRIFTLDEDLLQKTPLKGRLLFKMGGATLAPVLVHQSIGGLFRTPGVQMMSVVERAEMNGVLLED